MHFDLGKLDGPVLLFGGPYSNLQATNSLFKKAKKRFIPSSHWICTGDVVAYCADPRETIRAVRKSGASVVAGNCEKQIGLGAEDCGCGFETGSTCDLLSAGWYAHASKKVTSDDRAWMISLPDVISFVHQGARYAVVHGGMTDMSRFIWPNDPEEVFEREFNALRDKVGPIDHVIAGHCGIPFMRETRFGRWINAGVIGMPPHDGRQSTRFAVLDGGEVIFLHLQYDASMAAAKMAGAGLTQGYEKSLLSGYWPSEDVLPPSLRAPSLASG